MKRWDILSPAQEQRLTLSRGGGISPLCAAVLAARGFASQAAVQAQFDTGSLSDPLLLRDMPEAVACINQAIENGTAICVYGDYDCDGVTATVMLFDYLSCQGANVRYYIPERAEGYGMNGDAIRKLAADGVKLIITVDSGISALEEAQLAKSLGMTLVITDHHQPGAQLPEAAAVVNPHRADCPAPFKSLCGAGVVLKLIAALDGGDCDMALEQFGDLAVLGTIADIVPLTGENRFLAERGLTYIQHTERPGLLALMHVAGVGDKPVDAHTIGFVLAPRINAAGRFGSPRQAAELLLCQDDAMAEALANELNALNQARKDCENDIMRQVLDALEHKPSLLEQRVLLLWGEGWHAGVLGILAARLLERFGKPCILLTVDGDTAKGSMRSFEDFSAYKCLDACKDLLSHWGGHKGAGGLSLPADTLPALREHVEQYAKEAFPQMPILTCTALAITPEDISPENVASLSVLAPFGEENPEPLFALTDVTLTGISPSKNGNHTRLTLQAGTKKLTVFWFFVTSDRVPCPVGSVCDILLRLSESSYQGRTSILIACEALRPAALHQYITKQKTLTLEDSYFAARIAYETCQRGEALSPAYLQRMVPTHAELVTAYRAIPERSTALDTLFVRLVSRGINYCKLRICCDIFAERGLIVLSHTNETVQRLPISGKVDIFASPIYQSLIQLANAKH